MLEAYIDESQSYRPAPRVFVLAGHLASPERWAAFSQGWERKLAELHIEPPFKFSQSMMGKSEEVQSFISHQIKEYIDRHVQMRVAFAVNLDDVDNVMTGIRNPDYASPYFVSFFSMIARVSQNPEIKQLGGIRFIFDRRDQDKKPIRAVWRDFVAGAPEGVLDALLDEPLFRREEECPPLQAADFLAGAQRQTLVRQLKREAAPPIPWRKIPLPTLRHFVNIEELYQIRQWLEPQPMIRVSKDTVELLIGNARFGLEASRDDESE